MKDRQTITARNLTLLAEAAGRECAMVGEKWHRHRHGLVLDFLTDQMSAILRADGGYRDPFGTATERISSAFDRGIAEQERDDRRRAAQGGDDRRTFTTAEDPADCAYCSGDGNTGVVVCGHCADDTCQTCGTTDDLHRHGTDVRCHPCRLDDDLRAAGIIT